jgi:hypothetical protein
LAGGWILAALLFASGAAFFVYASGLSFECEVPSSGALLAWI